MRKLLLLCSLISLPLQAAVNAQVNVQTLTLGDALQLTIEADQKVRQNPDLSALSTQFRIVGSKQMTISSYTGGEPRFTTRWRVILRPLKQGAISIPAIRVGDERSLPISLTVLANERSASPLLSRQLILETELDTNEIYLHSQSILTVKLFHKQPLPEDARLSHPITTDAVIKPLGEDRRFSTRVRGQNYQVLERRYGIYPQQTGLIRLEPITYNDGKPRSLDQPLQKNATEIAVLPQAHQKRPGYWLPTTQVLFEDNLQPRNSTTMGQPIKRRLTLEAHGIIASELPALSPLKNELADIQLDNVILEEQMTDKGIISTRSEELTITPYERGEITLQEIRIPWWDVSQDREKEVALAARLINVSAASNADTPDNTEKVVLSDAIEATDTEEMAESTPNSEEQSTLLIWILTALAVISSLGWLYSFHRIRKSKEKAPEVTPLENSVEDIEHYDLAEASSFGELTQACDQNHCAASQILLLEWAQHSWPDDEIYNNEDVARASGSQTLQLLLMDMEHHLSHDEEHLWKGDLLIEALDKIRERKLYGSY